jgi:YjbE family integral membrane protein
MDWNWLLPWLTSLLQIVVIDLVLSGDNALIIGMASSNLSGDLRRRAIVWGTVGAVVLRVLLTILIVYFLSSDVIVVRLIGGLLLFWIAYKLLMLEEKEHESVEPGKNFFEAIKIIVVADITLSLDNMLAVAGAARGHLELVMIGLVLSIPLLMVGASIIATMVNRYPWLVGLGAALIAYIGAEMVLKDPVLKEIAWLTHEVHVYAPIFIGGAVFLYSFWLLRRRSKAGTAN